MSVTFKCNKTGNTVTFKSQYDIESMRQHPEYTEVQSTNEVKVLPVEEQLSSKKEQFEDVLSFQEQVKRVGRPRKAELAVPEAHKESLAPKKEQ